MKHKIEFNPKRVRGLDVIPETYDLYAYRKSKKSWEKIDGEFLNIIDAASRAEVMKSDIFTKYAIIKRENSILRVVSRG